MIGIIAQPEDQDVIAEFFELFKTPWEFYQPDREYDVLLGAQGQLPERRAGVIVAYAAATTSLDADAGIRIVAEFENVCLNCKWGALQLYHRCVTFTGEPSQLLATKSLAPVLRVSATTKGVLIRVGYDLFQEVRHLLVNGQPPHNAASPALEIHIALLRELLVANGVPLIEVPPQPLGHKLAVCLTHDVDHASIRNHKWDHTLSGFLYRALFGSIAGLLSGRRTLQEAALNWQAVLKLPFVHLDLAADFWSSFDKYLRLEGERPSTFFLLPFKNRTGRLGDGPAPARRASRYDIGDVMVDVQKLRAQGREVGLHGLDAWHDVGQARQERERISGSTGNQEVGVRMHWLYSDSDTPGKLEEAGFAYDSTVGFNETVGYRAGTGQVFKPLKTRRLLELPMLIMDTAMFYPIHLHLRPHEAWELVEHLIRATERFGGVLTVNWHDRSIVPERLWDRFYIKLLEDLSARGAWFCTAAQAVDWFRMRRTVRFEKVTWGKDKVRVKASYQGCADVPGLRLRVYRSTASGPGVARQSQSGSEFVEAAFPGESETEIAILEQRLEIPANG